MRHPPPRFVFVYGTLRCGEERDITALSPAPEMVGHGSVEGQLYDLGSYPGLRLGGIGRVEGEVYAISAALERRLDEIEAVSPHPQPQPCDEYVKREVRVQLKAPLAESSALGDAGTRYLDCLVYEATPHAVRGQAAIAGGDWVAYRRRLR